MKTSLRTHNCGELRLANQGQHVKLCGWVQEIRNKGHLIWIDLRDWYGITQIILERGTHDHPLFTTATQLKHEYVVCVHGKVVARSAKNPNIPTGDIEIVPTNLELLNKSRIPPFVIRDEMHAQEALHMRYRYLDLRRKPVKEKLFFRHQVIQKVRSLLHKEGFLEVETPLLIKSTPEGAQDFVVPARMHPGKYYALPQSPQLYKQLLMIGGIDRYYQIAKCFRDEDLRADRQPEFTQIDCEMAFVNMEDVLQVIEKMIQALFASLAFVTLPPFPRMTYQQAMRQYGSDKPDLRWDMPLFDLTDVARGLNFPPWQGTKAILGLKVTSGSHISRKGLDNLTTFLKEKHPQLSALVHVKYLHNGSITSSAAKFFPTKTLIAWCHIAHAKPQDLLLILAGNADIVPEALTALRKKIIQEASIPPQKTYAPVWITSFPMFQPGNKKYQAVHHPFTAPEKSSEKLLDSQPLSARAQAYDLVINGVELGSGSIRICNKALQESVFRLLGMSKKTIETRFGFFLRALSFGAPPHGGIAIGLDRLCILLSGGNAIRDYIPFPKNNQGQDTMIGAPAPLPQQQ